MLPEPAGLSLLDAENPLPLPVCGLNFVLLLLLLLWLLLLLLGCLTGEVELEELFEPGGLRDAGLVAPGAGAVTCATDPLESSCVLLLDADWPGLSNALFDDCRPKPLLVPDGLMFGGIFCEFDWN